MAVNDVTVFDEAKAKMIDGNWSSTDTVKCSLHTGAIPTAGDVTPTYADYSGVESTAVGSYTAGGYTLQTVGDMVTETGGTMTFDTTQNPTWTQNASNSSAVTYGLIYNSITGDAIAFVETGTVDMTAGALTITWSASGIFSIT